MTARLPIPGSDNGQWGNILNDFLSQAHNPDGTLVQAAQIAQASTQAASAVQSVNGKTGATIILHASDVGAPTTLAGLSDVATSSIADKQVLAYDSATSQWKNHTPDVPMYNVGDYGAVGDGTTDDTAAIQAALNAAYAAGGGVVALKTTTYIIDPNPGLQVKSGVTLQGNGLGSVLKLKSGSTHNDNIVKSENWTNVTLQNFTVDGNRTAQAGSPGNYTYTQYAIYLGGTNNSLVRNIVAKNTTGVGIHIYNCTSVTVEDCYSIGNNFHGYELEQDAGCHLMHSRGNGNLFHGVLISPGEVGGVGAKGNSVIGCTFDSNSQYGIATNAANGDVSAWLSEGNMFVGNTVTGNSQYGINFYKQDKHVFTNNYVAGNGYFGLYAFQSSDNTIQNNIFLGNSQAGNGSYDEIMLEGNSSGHASTNNNVSGNTILITASTKARYAINEATSGDGPSTVLGNVIPSAGTSGTINIQSSTSLQTSPAGVQQVYGGNAIDGANAGIDNAFNILRLYSNLANSEIQLASSGNGVNIYSLGNNVMTAYNDTVTVRSKLVMPTSLTPSSASDSGVSGQIAWDASYVYVCIANNTWKRSAISSW